MSRPFRSAAAPALANVLQWRILLASALLIAAALAAPPGFAEDDARSEDRQQLRALMAEVEAGINAKSVDRLTAMMADDVTVTWLNAVVSRGKGEVRDYYNRMVGGPGTILSKYITKVSLGAPARFYGDIAVAEGSAADEFFPHERGPFRLDSRWSSTLRKVDGQWRIVTLNLSTNVFTNPLMAEAERWIWYASGGGLLAGLIAGALLLRLVRR